MKFTLSLLLPFVLLLTGCSSTSPTTQPSGITSAQQTLTNIETTELAIYDAILILNAAGKIPPADYVLAQKANAAFQAVAQGVATKLANRQSLTSTDVTNALANGLAEVSNVHAQAVSHAAPTTSVGGDF